jgi:hypothetical protein
MKNFALSYDPVASSPTNKQLMAFVSSNRNVMSWSKPYEGLILIKSGISKETLYQDFVTFFDEGVQFLLFEIAVGYSVGRFTQVIWDWFRQGSFLSLLSQKAE